ncbi:MAG: methylamine utilization protein [Rhodospirillaceae bacterium]|jgi:plastocyanin|nr:methylamine utilization protein [Rhodospirillaceae bacterium]MBT5894640.1 methylamine utilization protein [Rhodospirillaceae bacterium]MBT6426833.1 methylamine utilization protein [Rhodospirillaceae bacterium]MBT7760357.1 methylamine utilization protein [Rhodospirillaceae bacterium]
MKKIFTPIAAGLLTGLFLSATIVAAQGKVSEIVISQKGKKFVPGRVEAKVGDVLTFVNEEKRKRHNVYSKTAGFKYLKIRKQKPGDRDSVTLKNAGTATIRCALHPKMKLTVVVTE